MQDSQVLSEQFLEFLKTKDCDSLVLTDNKILYLAKYKFNVECSKNMNIYNNCSNLLLSFIILFSVCDMIRK